MAKKLNDLNALPTWHHCSIGHFHSMNDLSRSLSGSMASTSSTMKRSPGSIGYGGVGSLGGGGSGS